MKFLPSIFLFALLSSFFSIAFGDSENDLLGKWKADKGVMEFFDNGTFAFTAGESGNSPFGFTGRYQVYDGDILATQVEEGRELLPYFIVHFTISNGEITLSGLKNGPDEKAKKETMQRINPASPSKADKPYR